VQRSSAGSHTELVARRADGRGAAAALRLWGAAPAQVGALFGNFKGEHRLIWLLLVRATFGLGFGLDVSGHLPRAIKAVLDFLAKARARCAPPPPRLHGCACTAPPKTPACMAPHGSARRGGQDPAEGMLHQVGGRQGGALGWPLGGPLAEPRHAPHVTTVGPRLQLWTVDFGYACLIVDAQQDYM
jgi:hypothetical protein